MNSLIQPSEDMDPSIATGEEKAKRQGWQFSLRSLLLWLMIVGLASGWLLTVVQHREEVKILKSQLSEEKNRAARMYQYYMSSNEETKSQLMDAYKKTQQ